MAYLNGGRWDLVAEFTETESGKHADRPQLQAALAACRKHKAKLVIAKLDRLSRNVAFIATMMDSKVEFVACDFPEANRLTLHILAAVAEHERKMISDRTKAALKATKKPLGGRRPGAYDISQESRRGVAARKAKADSFAQRHASTLRALRSEGLSFAAIAERLNAQGLSTARESTWTATAVSRALARI
jgi:DNA invertase Pin-like site-specific DNA recombinase